MSRGEIFKIGDEVIVVCDHDGPDGPWVCTTATIVAHNPEEYHQWKIKNLSGSELYCHDDMITLARPFDEIPEFGGQTKRKFHLIEPDVSTPE